MIIHRRFSTSIIDGVWLKVSVICLLVSPMQIIQEGSNIVDGDNDTPVVDYAFDEDRLHDDNLDQMLRDVKGNYSERIW